uniref:Helicase ATP-binding domain-containing protein n=1 Tax=Amphimedon queenslandica TaxID=400682 RepID=A0A1X7SJP4_AMPQE
DQVQSLKDHGIRAGHIDSDSAIDIKEMAHSGAYNILFISPEMLVGKGKEIVRNDVFKKNLVGLIIDEAHCVVKWLVYNYTNLFHAYIYRGKSFRDSFLQIREVRSILSSKINIMALTATAISQLRIRGAKAVGDG